MPTDVSHLRQPPDGSDCTKCGLCCVSPYPDVDVYPEVDEGDYDELPPGFIRRNVKAEGDRYAIKARWKKQPKGSPLEGRTVHVCAALQGALGKKCSCSIYSFRPECCYSWEPRNATCMRIRLKFVQAVEAGKPQEALD